MAGKISDEQFKEEMLEFKTDMVGFQQAVMRFIEVANQKFDGLTSDVRSNGFRMDKIENRMENVEAKLQGVEAKLQSVEAKLHQHDARFDRIDRKFDTMSDQFRAVTNKVFENEDLLKSVDARVAVLEGETH